VMYAIHRVTANDLLFEPLAHKHLTGRKQDCVRRYLEGLGVPRRLSLDAYRVIRDTCLSRNARQIFHLQNSEVTLIQLTFTISTLMWVAGLYRWSRDIPTDFCPFKWAAGVCVISLALGTLGASRICHQQYAYVKSLADAKVHNLVREIAAESKSTE